MQHKRLYTTFSGKDTGGLGSILQLQQHLYAYCKLNDSKFHFPGFEKLSHYQPYGISQKEFCDKLNSFYNIPNESNDNPQFVDECFLVRDWGERFNSEKRPHIRELANYIKYDGVSHFKKDQVNVCLHVRVDNNQDNGLVIPDVEIYYKNDFKDTYFRNIINNLKKINPNLNILLFSQGDKENFSHFEEDFGVKLLLNADIVESLYHLIFADILVTSNSSFSYCSHLFDQNKVVISRDNFFHSWYETTALTDKEGNFIRHEEIRF